MISARLFESLRRISAPWFCILLGAAGWTNVAAVEWHSLYPCSRRSSTAIVDTLNHRLILFGGTSANFDDGWYNDVWQLPLGDEQLYRWLPLTASGTPPAGRAGHVLQPVSAAVIVRGIRPVGCAPWALRRVLG